MAQSRIPSALPPLPSATGLPWSAEIVEAHRGLVSAFRTSRRALNLDESDPIRLGHHLKQAETFMTSIVEVLSAHIDNPLPSEYIESIKEAVGLLVDGLQVALGQATLAETSRVSQINVIALERSGKRGRPRKVVSEAFLKEAFKPGRNISVSKLASSLSVHKNTLKNYMRRYKIGRQPFSTISNSSLDAIVKQYKDARPNTGIRYLRGYLFQQGMRVQRERIVASLSRVDNVAKVVLRNKVIKRRDYKSARPNALWHVDGHHKLGLWGIVIHGFTDGYDRVVVGMRASSRNTAQTVLKLFLDSIKVYGCPYRVRGDRGSENVDLCTWMIMYRGPNRASFMWGTSTNNTRIERLWLESGRHFARGWRAFFTRLERLHFLNRDDPHHIWLLHTLFLEDIQHDCNEFQEQWNSHPLSGKGQNMSPLDLRFLGQTQYGVYDEAENLDPTLLHRYYGAANHSNNDPGSDSNSIGSGSTNSSNESDSDSDSGSGSDPDSSSDSDSNSGDSNPNSDSDGNGDSTPELEGNQTVSWGEIAETISRAQKCNIRHEAAEVAKAAMPFGSEDEVHAFSLALDSALSSSEYPAGFGLDEEYEALESYKTGRSSKPLVIPLPYGVWFPRIVVWCKALDLLKRLPLCKAAVVSS